MTEVAAFALETEPIAPPLVRPGSGRVFLLAFALALVIGIFIQKVLLPIVFPQWDAGHGLLLDGDWVNFHEQGAKLADQIARYGWKEFQLRPNGSSPGAIAGVVYYLTGIHEPWAILPLNAALFGLAAAGLFTVFSRVDQRRAFVALMPFLLFPSSVLLYAQIHKDVWAVAGFAWLVFVGGIIAEGRRISLVQCFGLLAIVSISVAFIWLVRPYLCEVMLGALTCGTVLVCAWNICTRSKGGTGRGPRHLALLVCSLAVIAFFAVDIPGRFFPSLRAPELGASSTQCEPRQPNLLDRFMPSAIRRTLDAVINDRLSFQTLEANAGSAIDLYDCFTQPSDVLFYVPRSLQIALFAPFPDTWFAQGVSPGSRVMRLVASLEMTITYSLLPGILFSLALGGIEKRKLMVLGLAIALPVMSLYAIAMPNVGTLYRMRFGCYALLLGFAIIGWAEFLSWFGKRKMHLAACK